MLQHIHVQIIRNSRYDIRELQNDFISKISNELDSLKMITNCQYVKHSYSMNKLEILCKVMQMLNKKRSKLMYSILQKRLLNKLKYHC